jgi:hypothetical protein
MTFAYFPLFLTLMVVTLACQPGLEMLMEFGQKEKPGLV